MSALLSTKQYRGGLEARAIGKNPEFLKAAFQRATTAIDGEPDAICRN
jgi:hypothetical protein